MRNNPLVVHYHIFKNAGTSVDYALKSAFGTAWAPFEGKHPHDILSREKLRAFLDLHPEIMAVSSHLARPPLPFENCLPILFLRHPILRAKSVYEFVKSDSTQPNYKLASTRTFSEFTRCLLFEDSGGVTIKNYQVIHLSDASFRDKSILDAIAQPADLRQAETLLLSWPAFGIVESYAKSMSVFEVLYGDVIHGLRLPIVRLNKSDKKCPYHNISIEAQVEVVHDELGDNLFDALCLANVFDLSLYQSCTKRFEENAAKCLGTLI